MLLELFFVATLDMSMPEFQPYEDISGNVIVSEVDDVSGEFIAEEIPFDEIPIENTSELPLLGLSQEEEPTEEEDISDIEYFMEIGSSKENSFKSIRSVESNNVITLPTSNVNNISIDWNTNKIASGSYGYVYVRVYSGTLYTVDTSSPNYFFTTSFNIGSSVTTISKSETSYLPNVDGYLFVRDAQTLVVSYVDNSGGDVSGDSPGGNISADLTNVESKLDNVIVLQRSILMTLLVTFLFPIVKSCVNLLKGGKDV